MKPVEINEFVLPKEGMHALEGWLVYVSPMGRGIGLERLLAKSNDGIYQGIIVPYKRRGIHVTKDGVTEAIESGIYVHGVPVTLHKKGKLWTSELAETGSFLIPFEKEAIALLDDEDLWYLPWTVLLYQGSLRRRRLGKDSLSFPSD